MQNTDKIWTLVDSKRQEFLELADRIWDNPEIAYDEPQPSPHFGSAIFGTNMPAIETASARLFISGASLCCGMLGMRS